MIRAITSVGPPTGKPTTTRTGLVGYPAAKDGATPISDNRMAQTTRNDARIGFSLIFFVGGIIGGHAARSKSYRRDLGCRCYCLLISASRMILLHFSVSPSRNLQNSGPGT